MNPDYEIRQMAKAQGNYKVSCPLKMRGMTHLQVSSTPNHRYTPLLIQTSRSPSHLTIPPSSVLPHLHSQQIYSLAFDRNEVFTRGRSERGTLRVTIAQWPELLENYKLHSETGLSDGVLRDLYLRRGSKGRVGSLQEHGLSYRVVPLEVRWDLV